MMTITLALVLLADLFAQPREILPERDDLRAQCRAHLELGLKVGQRHLLVVPSINLQTCEVSGMGKMAWGECGVASVTARNLFRNRIC